MVSLFGNKRFTPLLMVTVLLSPCFGIASNGIGEETPEIFTVKPENSRPEVKISQGTLRGVNLITHHGRRIYGFKGIPYARPPVADLRFKGPVPADVWNGTLDASKETTPCPQQRGSTIIGDEDCLYLNVHTPRLPLNESSQLLLPVILYVLGGAFKTGHNSHTRFGPYFLLDKDVLLVVPSYRMGVLGYLSTGDEVAPGNYALKDLVRALQWNRENIEYFGGDPNQVTLMGGSSGANSAHLLTLSNATKGLFNKFITQSGSALSLTAHRPRKEVKNFSIQLGTHLGCPTNSSILLINCLRGIDVFQLVSAERLFKKWMDFPIIVWGPTIEPDIEGAVLTEPPGQLFATGKIPDLPRLACTNRHEGTTLNSIFHDRPDRFEEFLDKIDAYLPSILQYDSFVDNVTAYTNAAKSYYLNDFTADRTLLLRNYTQLTGDSTFTHPIYHGVQRQYEVYGKNNTYLCSFEYRGTFSFTYSFTGGSTKNYGVSHGDELLYLFKNLNNLYGPPTQKMNEADLKMVDTMVQLWTSFAITGMPTAYPISSVIWEPYSWRKNYLRIGSNSDTSIEMKDNFWQDRMQFWENLTAATTWKEPF